ncbi:tyrosine-type recombinase/integrase [Streptomyces sp. NPDC059697]|uniref:tyrosine-type recombinase/integrase n=1 Tax=Streptomyces sp. NPDC059697 TaxID=3346912 RepID=UPI0036AD9AD8
METTYDVKVYKILTYKGAWKTTYTVRWVLAGKRWREPFGTVALAEGFRSELIRATGKGGAFVTATGLPVSHRSKSASMSWYTFAVEYVDSRWPELGGNSRKNTAKTLTAATNSLPVSAWEEAMMNADQAAALLDWIRRRPRGGMRLHAFFATLYYCGLRPEEAVAMRVKDMTLPGPDDGDQWCELLIHTATPEVGKQWTDTGEIHEERDLKGHADGETRTVPGHPALTRILRQHMEDEQLKPGNLLFQGETGGILAGSVVRRAWRSARKAVLLPHVFESPTGRRVHDNRHTRLTKWLNDGIPPAQVAEWAGTACRIRHGHPRKPGDSRTAPEPPLDRRGWVFGASPCRADPP